jgi:hypothetical protein
MDFVQLWFETWWDHWLDCPKYLAKRVSMWYLEMELQMLSHENVDVVERIVVAVGCYDDGEKLE